MPAAAKAVAVEDVNAAVVGRRGPDRPGGRPAAAPVPAGGRPAAAHAAVEDGAVGKVLVALDDDPPARVG